MSRSHAVEKDADLAFFHTLKPVASQQALVFTKHFRYFFKQTEYTFHICDNDI